MGTCSGSLAIAARARFARLQWNFLDIRIWDHREDLRFATVKLD